MLKKHADVKWCVSAPIEDKKFSTPIYCEDRRVSLPSAGVRFPAGDVREFEAQIPDFTSDQLQQLLDVWSAFYDLSTYQSEGTRDTVGPSDKKMIATIQDRVKEPSVQSIVGSVLSKIK